MRSGSDGGGKRRHLVSAARRQPQTRTDRLARLVTKLGLDNAEDLLSYFPREYVSVRTIGELRDGERAAVVGLAGQRKVVRLRSHRGRMLIKYSLELSDDTGRATVVSFAQGAGRGWSPLKLLHPPGTRLLVEGSVKRPGQAIEIQHHDSQRLAKAASFEPGQLLPVYPLVNGVHQGEVRASSRLLLTRLEAGPQDPLPEALRQVHKLVSLQEALSDIHWPACQEAQREARRRLVFEELFLLELALAARKQERRSAGRALPVAPAEAAVEMLESELGFKLTGAQRRAIQEVVADLAAPGAMNRLLQGDVGSGKTLVAAAAMLLVAKAGYQSALMAPTELLAEQHYLCLQDLLARRQVRVELLTASQPAPELKRARENLRSGVSRIAIGTQALLAERVEFRRLALVVIDEQHRFGVMERSRLRGKGETTEMLVMTATPIPRTLALTLYGDLDISILDELPPGRRPVETSWLPASQLPKAWELLRREIEAGKQGYVVCPLIEESEHLQAQAAESLARELREGAFSDVPVGLVHGRLTLSERERVMGAFRRGEVQVLVATTVIEVGVDVPNASMIILLSPERFGLAQLHQLRGRVGRSSAPARCLLVTQEPAAASDFPVEEDGRALARRRLEVLMGTNDGFRLAEEDLRLRGPGEVMGIRQHGLPDFRLADLVSDGALLREAREVAFSLFQADPDLRLPGREGLRGQVEALRARLEQLPA